MIETLIGICQILNGLNNWTLNKPYFDWTDIDTVKENINGAPPQKCEIIFDALSICSLFKYWDGNIGLFSTAAHKDIALPTLR